MGTSCITLGQNVNMLCYDNGVVTNSIEVVEPIKQTSAPSASDDVMRLGDVIPSGEWVHDSYGVNTTLDNTNEIVEVTASGVTITLQSYATTNGKVYIINNASSGDITVDVTGGVETIHGETSQTIPPDDSMSVFAGSSEWRIF